MVVIPRFEVSGPLPLLSDAPIRAAVRNYSPPFSGRCRRTGGLSTRRARRRRTWIQSVSDPTWGAKDPLVDPVRCEEREGGADRPSGILAVRLEDEDHHLGLGAAPIRTSGTRMRR